MSLLNGLLSLLKIQPAKTFVFYPPDRRGLSALDPFDPERPWVDEERIDFACSQPRRLVSVLLLFKIPTPPGALSCICF